MAKITPTQNTSSQNQDPIVLSTSATGQLKRAVNATALTPTGSDYPAAAQMVGTHGDDAAFTPASTDPIVVIGGFADETSTDSVDEGDAGALRMTLNRRLITAGQVLDDAAFGVGTEYVTTLGALADETSTDSVDEGDTGAVRMTLDRRLHTVSAGDVAHDAVDSGMPVKVGGRAVSVSPTAVANGDRVNAQFDLRGAQAAFIVGRDGFDMTPITWSQTDGVTPGNIVGLAGNTLGWLYNGSTIDRARANMDQTVLASAARTATIQSADLTNYNGRGLHLVIDVTSITATPSVVFTIQGKDALSGQYYTILASVAITAVGTTVLRVYPGLTAAANTVANDILPRTWRVNAVHADADSITYSVAASTIL